MRFQHRSNFFVTPVVSPHQLDGVTGNIQQWVCLLYTSTESGHEYCGQYADGNSYDESACGDIDRTDDHRQYAVKIVGRTPLGSKQEIEDSYLSDGRYSAGE